MNIDIVDGVIATEDDKTELLLIQKERVLCSDIKSDFKHMDANVLISLATKN
jgi:predicted protein tyrosine phosphatase